MEEVVGGFGLLILRGLKWLVITALVEFLIYWYGYITLKILTLGHYPKLGEDSETMCIITGVVSIALTIVLIAVFV
ncbi:MAG: hypothetical protein ABJK37_08415 [Paraglaciecola sp.]|uniref:hypothetical protein n=1 Tax=Paraglaciecola sp. TaxID=1920173 RepID=UPI00329714EA